MFEAYYNWVLDELIDYWHEAPEDGQPLHEFIGWTHDEYKVWIEQHKKPFHFYNDVENGKFDDYLSKG